MNKQSTVIALVLVVLAVALGGLLAWMTAPEPEEIASPEADERVVASVDEGPVAPPSDLEVPEEQKGVERYLEGRFPGYSDELLGAASTTLEGRPLYHSKTVFVSVDQDGNPRYTRPSWSPYDESTLNMVDKQVDRAEYGQYSGVSIPVDAPSVKKLQQQSEQRLENAKLLQKWANEQVEMGNVDGQGLPKLPKDMDAFLDKLKLEERKQAEKKNKQKKNQGGQDAGPKKKKNQQAPKAKGPKQNG